MTWLTAREAAEYLGVSMTRLQQLRGGFQQKKGGKTYEIAAKLTKGDYKYEKGFKYRLEALEKIKKPSN